MSELRQVPGVVSQVLEGEVLLLRPGASEVVRLNATGSHLWRLLEQPTSLDRLVAEMSDEYGIPSEQAREDLAPAVALLVAQGLVEMTGS